MSETVETTEKTEPTVLPRIQLLREAAAIVAGERNVAYGEPEDNFKRIAQIWSVVLGMTVTAEDVAMCLVGLKVARYGNRGTFQPDTWRDIAGYAGCGYEVGLSGDSK